MRTILLVVGVLDSSCQFSDACWRIRYYLQFILKYKVRIIVHYWYVVAKRSMVKLVRKQGFSKSPLSCIQDANGCLYKVNDYMKKVGSMDTYKVVAINSYPRLVCTYKRIMITSFKKWWIIQVY